jgi:hypothetical protein
MVTSRVRHLIALKIAGFGLMAFITALPFAVAASSTSGTSTTTSGECRPEQNYLDTQLKDPTTSDCAACSVGAGEFFSSLRSLGEDSHHVSTEDRALPLECFDAVMAQRPPATRNFRYGVCQSPTSRPVFQKGGHPIPVPCINPALLKVVQTALAETSECIGVDQKEIFATFGWESHFQPNLASSRSTNSEGLAQLNSIATYDVDLMHRFAEDEGKPECKRFENIFKESQNRRVKKEKHIPECSLISGADGILRNLLYGEATFRYFKRISDKWSTQLVTSPEDRARISTDLARQMYNGGESSLSQIFRFMTLRLRKTPITYTKFKTRFSQLVLEHYGRNSDGTAVAEKKAEDLLADAKRAIEFPRKIEDLVIEPLKKKGLGAKCVSH